MGGETRERIFENNKILLIRREMIYTN